MITRRSTLGLLAAAPLALTARQATAMTDPVFSEGAAIRGADPVAYFTLGVGLIGDSDISADWNGATWHFVTEDHRAAFVADPEAYAPQYGGYCAFAMSRGYIAPTVPEAWTIHEGKLYLNFSLDVRSRWQNDIPGNIAAADDHWPEVLG